MSQADKKLRFIKELHRLWGMNMSRDYKVTRRDLMKGMAGLGLSATAISMIMRKAPLSVKRAWAAEGNTPEERAVNGAKALFANAKKKTISIMHPSGSGGNMSPFSAEWKDLTGFDVELIEVPGANHFTIMNHYAGPDSDLCRAMVRQMGLGEAP